MNDYVPLTASLSPTAQAALDLVADWREQSTSVGPYLLRTWVLPDGRYITTLSRDGEWLAEVQSHTAGTAQGNHRAMVETLRQGLGPHAPQAAVQAPPPASTVVWSIWCRDGEQEDIHGALYRTESGAQHACADLQQRHPRQDWRVLPLEVAAEEE